MRESSKKPWKISPKRIFKYPKSSVAKLAFQRMVASIILSCILPISVFLKHYNKITLKKTHRNLFLIVLENGKSEIKGQHGYLSTKLSLAHAVCLMKNCLHRIGLI